MTINLTQKIGVSYGPYIDGRNVVEFGITGLPVWAASVFKVAGEPGAGEYMTLPTAAGKDHPWLTTEERSHFAIERYGR
jgi:hypothetical protein